MWSTAPPGGATDATELGTVMKIGLVDAEHVGEPGAGQGPEGDVEVGHAHGHGGVGDGGDGDPGGAVQQAGGVRGVGERR